MFCCVGSDKDLFLLLIIVDILNFKLYVRFVIVVGKKSNDDGKYERES